MPFYLNSIRALLTVFWDEPVRLLILLDNLLADDKPDSMSLACIELILGCLRILLPATAPTFYCVEGSKPLAGLAPYDLTLV